MAGANSLDTVDRDADATARRRARDVLFAAPRLVSITFGTWFWWEALVPSLLPRSGLLQGVIGGVSFAVGWLVGSIVGQLWDRAWRRSGRRDPLLAVRPWPLVVVVALAVIAAVLGTVLWLGWQNQQRTVVGPDEVLGLSAAISLWLVTLVIAAIAVGIGRLVWFLAVRINDQLPQRWPSSVRHLVAGAGFGVLVVGVVAAILSFVVVPLLDAQYAQTDAAPVPGLLPPQTATVSGGPGSLVDWSSLGAEGRMFTATATSTDALRTFRPGSEPKQPVRVYVGLRSAPDAAARADLAVKEMERAGAFERRYLVVWTVTGTGWVDPVSAAALEYVAGGDTAIIAQQYSYLPSWISFLVDQDEAAEAGTTLYNAVHARWAQLPAANRPRLVVFGESLGSFGSESSFGRGTDAETLSAASSAADSVLWVGPTNGNAVWNALQNSRQPASPVWAPVYGDGSMRLADHGENLTPPTPKVLWVQHPSDPVGWWSWSTFWAKPAWMHQPTGDDVPKEPSWFPVVSMLQATFDLMNGFSASPGHGHNYNPDFGRAWAALMAPPDWTAGDTERLAQILVHVSE
ncbi:MAG TPA: alpha/beta-hydrolase family protein [Lapillicoccus sp.]|nr:alpha/beta-hydrolase family protein [Lapillicoccus sp.]